nr:hypothetical protein BDOA9_0106760 [Bradyrhizobium sp. DOA9]
MVVGWGRRSRYCGRASITGGVMQRREFLALIGVATAWSPLARAQQPKKVPHIGFLTTGSVEQTRTSMAAFHQGLRERGYIDGENIVVEFRAADSKVEQLPALASELVRLNPALIVAQNTLAARAVQQATKSIPVVVPVMGDPVEDGLVASIARPGGNITGLTFIGPQLVPKRLAQLKEALPMASRIAAIWHPAAYGKTTTQGMISGAESASKTVGVHLQLIAVQDPDGLGEAFSTLAGARADAVFLFPSPMFFIARKRIADLAAEHRLPLFAIGKEFVQLGALLSYGADIIDLNRLSTDYVDKILKGAKPGDLPVEQPTKYELFINLKTAKTLGIEVPAALLAHADGVIE